MTIEITTSSNAYTHRYDVLGHLVYCSHAQPWVFEDGTPGAGRRGDCPHLEGEDWWTENPVKVDAKWDRVIIWREGEPPRLQGPDNE